MLLTGVLVIVMIVAGVSLRLRSPPGALVLLGGGTALAVGMVYQVLFGAGETPELPRAAARLEQAAGNILAGFVVEDFPEGGVVVVLRYPPVSLGDRETTQARFLALRNTLGERFSFIQCGPPNFDTSIPTPADFQRLDPDADWMQAALGLAKKTNAVAVVSLLPHIPAPESLPSTGPKIYLFNDVPDLDEARMLSSSRIAAIIIPGNQPPPDQPPSTRESDATWFAIAYRVLRR